jgi:hypothetical protein
MQVPFLIFLGGMDHYKKDNVHYIFFVEDLGLLVIKTIAHSIYSKYLTKTFSNAIMPSCCFPFQKNL